MQLRLVDNVRAGVGNVAGKVATVAGVCGDLTGNPTANAVYHGAKTLEDACEGKMLDAAKNAAKTCRFASNLSPADPPQPADNYAEQKFAMVA